MTAFQNVRFILTDVDDTLTYESSLPAETFQALHDLREAGYIVVPVTGGCAGWCDQMARIWPVEAVIGENGAFYLRKDEQGHVHYRHWEDAAKQKQLQQKLLSLAADALQLVPKARLAKDQAYRLADAAIDYNQDVSGITKEEVAKIVSVFETAGANARPSSIHVNAWFGSYNKKMMALKLLKDCFDLDAEKAKEQVLYIGDAPNDEPMFEYFPISFGVANIRKVWDSLHHRPRWVTQSSGGYGFAEMADGLLSGDMTSAKFSLA
ncbi:HAD-IIB family hydrolase [Sneathiella sp.]|jgi:HAD superfamily hydrolase (TIGR01484 family)|uniref:HAD-IIB family hydrolase n=1 Tax=Sneathiella sp. TaxID=1964365 RepID=UPI0039E629D4